MPGFSNVGPALRYLRIHGGREPRKQMDVAASAAVTRGMLSSYERGKQEPSLGTLERVLEALGADLVKLQWALRMVETEPGGEPVPAPPLDWRSVGEMGEVAEPPAVYRAVSVPEPLSPEEEHALGQMIAGFLSYLRFTRDERPAPNAG
jgi:transcriptional regulator with XRE-family HTH domain